MRRWRARALGIVLTKRGKHQGHDIPMCGVPVHAADDYLQKLIGAGLPRRRLRADRGSGRGEEARREIGGAARRGAAGDARHDHRGQAARAGGIELPDGAGPGEGRRRPRAMRWPGSTSRPAPSGSPRPTADRLLADIFRVDPRELIVAEPVFHDPELKPVFDVLGRVASPQPPSAVRFGARPPARIARFFDVATPDGFGTFSRAELSAISRRRRLCREDAEGRAAAAVAARARGAPARRCSSTRRRAPISNCCARCRGEPRRLAVQGDRPHGDRRRRAAAGRPADGAADRSGGDRRSGWMRSSFFRAETRLCQALRGQPEGRRRHAARAVAAGARPRRPARPRRAARRLRGGRRDRRHAWPRPPCPTELAAALAAIDGAARRRSRRHLDAGARRRTAAAEARRRLRARRLPRRTRRDAGAARRVAPGDRRAAARR